jgi:benzoyl-CoA reductase subunit BamC
VGYEFFVMVESLNPRGIIGQGALMKKILVDFNKCTGCRSCELICSLHHYKVINPKKSRIRVIRDFEKGHFYPLIAGPVADAECKTKSSFLVGGEEYDQCLLCRAICPSRPFFKDPDTGEQLTCDLCTMCVKFCNHGA